jgi:AAA domain
MSQQDILDFFTTIYDQEIGVVCVALKDSSGFKRSFFNWPDRGDKLAEYVDTVASTGEVYFAPALFHSESALKQNVKGAKVFWVEFDGNAPDDISNIPPPTIRVRSSKAGHEHWYWKLDHLTTVDDLERINRALTYTLGADISGWDANQILRPPSTYNHKKESPTELLESNGKIYTIDTFAWIPGGPDLPPRITVDPKLIVPLEKLVFKYTFPQYVVDLFTVGTGNRSDGLMQLGYELAERQVANEDILSLMIHADKRWGKFSERDDQFNRLLDIISLARSRYPLITTEAQFSAESESMGFMDVLRSDVHVEWIIEGLLETKGNCMVTGAPGAGKTQFSLAIAEHLALGKPLLEFKIPQPRKVGFFSLEMDLATIKHFLEKNAKGYTDEEKEVLQNNFRIFPLGQPLWLNLPDQQDKVKARIVSEGLEVICIDSLSQATSGSLIEEGAIRALMGWLASIRQSTGVAVWWIHHNRKASGQNTKPKKLEDVYGSQFITAAVTSAVTLWPLSKNNLIELSFLKTRLQERSDPVNMIRDRETLLFSRETATQTVEIDEDEKETSVVFSRGKLKGI